MYIFFFLSMIKLLQFYVDENFLWKLCMNNL